MLSLRVLHYNQYTKYNGSTTGHSAPTSSSKEPPGDVRPGHIMFAPAKTNLIAPRSTCNFFIIFGSVKLKTIQLTWNIRKDQLQIAWCLCVSWETPLVFHECLWRKHREWNDNWYITNHSLHLKMRMDVMTRVRNGTNKATTMVCSPFPPCLPPSLHLHFPLLLSYSISRFSTL